MKMPDIQIRRNVPEFKSGRVAQLPNKMRRINAEVNAINTVAGATANAYEAEAKLSARARLNDAKTQYQTRVMEKAQDYHSDTSKDPAKFGSDMESIRSDVAGEVSKDMSLAARKHLDVGLGDYWTSVHSGELKAAKALTDSRATMHLEDIARAGNVAVMNMPDTFAGEIKFAFDAIDESVLPAETKRARKESVRSVYTKTAIAGLLDAQRVEDAVAMQSSEQFKAMSADDQALASAKIEEAAVDSMDADQNADINETIVGNMSRESAMTRVEERVNSLTMLDGAERDDFVREGQDEVLYGSLRGDVVRGKYNEVLAVLKSGEFKSILSAESTEKLYGQATRGLAGESSGMDMSAANATRANAKTEINRQVRQLSEGFMPSAAEVQSAQQALETLRTSYTSIGKSVPETYTTLKNNLDAAYTKAAVVDSYTMMPETARFALTKASPATAGGQEQIAWALEGLNNREKALATDAVSFARRDGWVVDPIRWGTETESDDVSKRRATFESMTDYYGPDVSGMFSADEMHYLNKAVTSMQDTGEFAQFAGDLNNSLGPDNAEVVWSQLAKDDELGLMPIAGRVSGQGRPEVAGEILLGEGMVEEGVRFRHATQVDDHIAESLGTAYGMEYSENGRMVYGQYVEAIEAQYTYLMRGEANRSEGLSYNDEVLDKAILDVTGGVYEVGGRSYVAPNANVSEEHFDHWYTNQSAETLPPLYASLDGEPIAAEEINSGWYRGKMFSVDRFVLVDAGAPGKYYVMDNRGRTSDGRGVPGALLMNANGGRATVEYKDGNYTTPDSTRRTSAVADYRE